MKKIYLILICLLSCLQICANAQTYCLYWTNGPLNSQIQEIDDSAFSIEEDGCSFINKEMKEIISNGGLPIVYGDGIVAIYIFDIEGGIDDVEWDSDAPLIEDLCIIIPDKKIKKLLNNWEIEKVFKYLGVSYRVTQTGVASTQKSRFEKFFYKE